MNNFKAVGIAEGYILAEDQDETLAAW
ncbi:MAG: hypothetical protein RLZZ454_98, partial [Pseudomonadota bacterium]